MGLSNPNWRDSPYSSTLQRIQETASLGVRQSTKANALTVVIPNGPVTDFPISSMYHTDYGTPTLSSSTTASSLFVETPQTESYHSESSNVAINSPYSSSSSLSPASPMNNQSEACCYLCDTVFHGTSCLTNLRRHLRTAKIHNGNVGILCPEGCGERLTRKDNLDVHRRNVHGLDTRSTLTGRSNRGDLMAIEEEMLQYG